MRPAELKSPTRQGVKSPRLTSITVGLGAALLGLLLAALPYDLERNLGLPLLFKLRGVRPAPSDVVIVAMNQLSARRLKLKSRYDRWPRRYHAMLVDRLRAAGAAVIALDVVFGPNDQQDPEKDDKTLALAIRKAGNVIVSAAIEEETIESNVIDGQPTTLTPQGTTQVPPIKKIRLPIPQIVDAAFAVAPFLIPPQSERIDTFWTFARGPWDLPTLPAAALQAYALSGYEELVRLGAAVDPKAMATLHATNAAAVRAIKDLPRLMTGLSTVLLENRELVRGILKGIPVDEPANPEEARRRLLVRALVGLYAEADGRYLNYIGPPLSIPSIAFVDAATLSVANNPERWEQFKALVRHKAVFVGAQEATIEDQKNSADAVDTVFTDRNGLRLQGVEIGATAFANLLEGNTLKRAPLLALLGILLGYGALLALTWRRLSLPMASGVIASSLFGYGAACAYLFKSTALWLPIIIPTLQATFSVFLALLAKRAELMAERSELVHQFSKALPPGMVWEYILTGRIRWNGYGVCLQSDIKAFTPLAVSVPPERLAEFINNYFSNVFDQVQGRNGYPMDTAGDGMLALWIQQSSPHALRHSACSGALDIVTMVEQFNASRIYTLRTRMGLDCGDLVVRDIGNISQFRVKPFGTSVNTASRIEGLNKQLGTQILASAEIAEGLEDFLWRPVGNFLLHGLDTPIMIYELVCAKTAAIEEQLWLCETFTQALRAYATRDLTEAESLFRSILEKHPDDGPSTFYLGYLTPDAWSLAIKLGK